jgi:hypothetical protein
MLQISGLPCQRRHGPRQNAPAEPVEHLGEIAGASTATSDLSAKYRSATRRRPTIRQSREAIQAPPTIRACGGIRRLGHPATQCVGGQCQHAWGGDNRHRGGRTQQAADPFAEAVLRIAQSHHRIAQSHHADWIGLGKSPRPRQYDSLPSEAKWLKSPFDCRSGPGPNDSLAGAGTYAPPEPPWDYAPPEPPWDGGPLQVEVR